MEIMLGLFNRSTLNEESQQNIILCKHCDISIISKEPIQSNDNGPAKTPNINKNLEKQKRFFSEGNSKKSFSNPTLSVKLTLSIPVGYYFFTYTLECDMHVLTEMGMELI